MDDITLKRIQEFHPIKRQLLLEKYKELIINLEKDVD